MKKVLRVQRLAQREERATVKRIISLSAFSIILAVFIFTLGIPLLGRFADVLDSFFGNRSEEQITDKEIPRPPSLDQLPQATNSAKLAISGFSDEGTVVDIYFNSEKVSQVKTRDGKFTYEDLILKDGENQISAKAASKLGKESDFSPTQTIILDKEEPTLEVETPAEGQTFSGDNRIRVSGKTDRDSQVYANGFLASVDFEGKFEVFVPAGEGETTIEIKAIDEAGNTKVVTRKINFRR